MYVNFLPKFANCTLKQDLSNIEWVDIVISPYAYVCTV